MAYSDFIAYAMALGIAVGIPEPTVISIVEKSLDYGSCAICLTS